MRLSAWQLFVVFVFVPVGMTAGADGEKVLFNKTFQDGDFSTLVFFGRAHHWRVTGKRNYYICNDAGEGCLNLNDSNDRLRIPTNFSSGTIEFDVKFRGNPAYRADHMKDYGRPFMGYLYIALDSYDNRDDQYMGTPLQICYDGAFSCCLDGKREYKNWIRQTSYGGRNLALAEPIKFEDRQWYRIRVQLLKTGQIRVFAPHRSAKDKPKQKVLMRARHDLKRITKVEIGYVHEAGDGCGEVVCFDNIKITGEDGEPVNSDSHHK